VCFKAFVVNHGSDIVQPYVLVMLCIMFSLPYCFKCRLSGPNCQNERIVEILRHTECWTL